MLMATYAREWARLGTGWKKRGVGHRHRILTMRVSQNKHKSIYYAEILTVVYFLDSGVSFLGERVRYELQRQVEAKTAAKAKIRAYHSNFRHNILKGVNGIRAIWGVSMKIIIDINAT